MPNFEAYDKFLTSLLMAESLLELEKSLYSNPPLVHEQPTVRGLRGGAIVLMVASFEFYLRELIMEALDEISRPLSGIAFPDMPDDMRVTSVFESLNLAMKGPRHEEAPPKVDRLTAIETCCRKIVAGNIVVEAFTDTGSNPGSKVVKSMFKNFGIPNVFTKVRSKFEARSRWGEAVADTFIGDKLDEIVGRRNVVAHTADTLELTRGEMRVALKFLRILGDVLDWITGQHVNQLKG